MDIEEIKKLAKNKIEAEDLTKQVRRQIKETTWAKQNLREGFSETFRPLISQFEKPEDPKQKNIFTQNQEMLRNQLALTEGLKANQKAITDGFSQFERLADMKELPGVEAIKDEAQSPMPKKNKHPLVLEKEDESPTAKFDVGYFDRYLNNKISQDILESNNYNYLPSYYFDKDVSEISSLIDNVNTNLEIFGNKIKNTALIGYNKEGYSLAKPLANNPQEKTLEYINNYNILSVYSKNLSLLFLYKNQSGYGVFFSPQELLHRFELLAGSLAAGNNGVLPEYNQIAHRLRDHGVISNKQLNAFLRKVI